MKLDWLKPTPKNIILTLIILLTLSVATLALVTSNKTIAPDITKVAQDSNRLKDRAYREQLIADSKADVLDYLILGNHYRADGDYKSAENAYKRAEKIEPNNFDVLYALASVYRLQQNKQQAVNYYQKVVDSASNKTSPYHVNLAIYLAEQKNIQDGVFNEGTSNSELPL